MVSPLLYFDVLKVCLRGTVYTVLHGEFGAFYIIVKRQKLLLDLGSLELYAAVRASRAA